MSPPQRPRPSKRTARAFRSQALSTYWQGYCNWLHSHSAKELLRRHGQKIFNLMGLLFFGVILLLALVPGNSRFETQVVTTRFGFETKLPSDQTRYRFLYSILNLQAVSLKGSYPEPIPLTGQFASEALGDLTELALEMPYDYSQIQFQPIAAPDADQPYDLAVSALQLQNQTVVEALQYIPFNRRLELQFSHRDRPDLLTGSSLELYLGQQPLQLILSGYRLSLPDRVLEDPDGTRPLVLTFQPGILATLDLPLPQKGTISLSLPPLTGIDTLRWFWGNWPITHVAFTKEEFYDGDELVRSSIRRGLLRIGDRELEIENNQFLLLKDPGIEQVRYLQLIADEGIEVRAMGETALAQVGLDPDFPVRGLRSNFITQLFDFAPDAVIAIVSFSGAMVATLSSWFVDNLFKSTDENR